LFRQIGVAVRIDVNNAPIITATAMPTTRSSAIRRCASASMAAPLGKRGAGAVAHAESITAITQIAIERMIPSR